MNTWTITPVSESKEVWSDTNESLNELHASDCQSDDESFTNLSENDHFEYLNNTGRGVLLTDEFKNKSRKRQKTKKRAVAELYSSQDEAENNSQRSRARKREPERKKRRSSSSKDKVAGIHIKPFPEGLNPSARRNEWIRWREQLTLLLSLKGSLKTQEEKRAFLVVSGGREIQKALSSKPATGERSEKPVPVFDNALIRLDSYFQTGTNAITDIIRFRKIAQKSGEQFIDFVHRLQEHAAHCNFGEAEENEILIQIQTNAIHAALLGQMMTRENKKLADVINYGSSLDNEASASGIETKIKREEKEMNDEVDAAYVQKSSYNRRSENNSGRYRGNRQRTGQPNQRSNRPPPHQDRLLCYNCKRSGHFARDCRSRRTHQPISYTEEDVKKRVRNEWCE